MSKVPGWMNLNDKWKGRQEKKEVKRLKEDYLEISGEAADVAAERLVLKEDYGTIVEEAADIAVERKEIKEDIQAIGQEVADVFAERTDVKATTFHLLKGNIGPGCLSLPWAFSQLGIPLALCMTACIAYWTYHNCMMLLNVKRTHTSNRRTVTYSDLGEIAYGRRFRSLVTYSIVSLQLAICTVFLSFVSTNTMVFFNEFLPAAPTLGESPALNIALVIPLVAALTLLPNFHALGPVSEIAMMILFSAFGVLGAVLVANWDLRPSHLPHVDWLKAPLAISGILYSFEGISIVLPLEATMKDRKSFSSVFSWAYAAVTVIYGLIGSICVFVLGAVNDGSITAFLLSNAAKYEGDLLVTIANLLVSAAVILTYALTMFPCIELWCQALERKERGDTLEPEVDEDDWWGGSLAYGPFDTPTLRLSLVASTVVAAVAIPNVKELIGLAGALAGASTALILPPLIALKFEAGDGMTLSKLNKYVLLLLGTAFGLFGAVAAIYDIIASF